MYKPIPMTVLILTLFALILAACQSPALTATTSATQSLAGLPGTIAVTDAVTQPPSPRPATPTETDSPEPQASPIPLDPNGPYPAPPVTGELATPESDSPAAGICDLVEDALVTFEIFPDIPSPRCAQAIPDQRMKVINRTDQILEVSLGGFAVSLGPGEETVFDTPLGDFLAPGVHRVITSAYGGGGGPELLLLEAVPTDGPYPAP